MQAKIADVLRKTGWILFLLLQVKLYAQVLPGDLMYRDSFPGVKSCMVRCMSLDAKDSNAVEKYSYKRYTYLPDGRKTGSFDFHRCGREFYADSTFDSVVYNKDGLIEKKIKCGYFYGAPKENQTEVFTYDAQKRLKKKTTVLDSRGWMSTQAYYYDDKGRVSMIADTEKHDTALVRYSYNERLRVMVYEAKHNYGAIDSTWYNENGDVIRTCVYLTATRNGEYAQRCWDSTIYQYNGRVPVRKEVYAYGGLDHIIYEYDTKGRIITIIRKQPQLDDEGMISRMIYDDHGNMIGRKETAPIDFEQADVWKITYNKRGLPVRAEHRSLYSNSLQFTQVYEYTYTYY